MRFKTLPMKDSAYLSVRAIIRKHLSDRSAISILIFPIILKYTPGKHILMSRISSYRFVIGGRQVSSVERSSTARLPVSTPQNRSGNTDGNNVSCGTLRDAVPVNTEQKRQTELNEEADAFEINIMNIRIAPDKNLSYLIM